MPVALDRHALREQVVDEVRACGRRTTRRSSRGSTPSATPGTRRPSAADDTRVRRCGRDRYRTAHMAQLTRSSPTSTSCSSRRASATTGRTGSRSRAARRSGRSSPASRPAPSSSSAPPSADAELVLVHHGLFWEGAPRRSTAPAARRLKLLFDHDMALAAYHLPLDGHPELGNNALLADALGCEALAPFPAGECRRSASRARFGERRIAPRRCSARACGDRAGREPLAFLAGPDPVRVDRDRLRRRAPTYLADAIAAGLDAFLTGEPAERVMPQAREAAIHFLAAGHYATETLRRPRARRPARRALRRRARLHRRAEPDLSVDRSAAGWKLRCGSSRRDAAQSEHVTHPRRRMLTMRQRPASTPGGSVRWRFT